MQYVAHRKCVLHVNHSFAQRKKEHDRLAYQDVIDVASRLAYAISVLLDTFYKVQYAEITHAVAVLPRAFARPAQSITSCNQHLARTLASQPVPILSKPTALLILVIDLWRGHASHATPPGVHSVQMVKS